MKTSDAICPACKAGFNRIELHSKDGPAGNLNCQLCDALLEIADGKTAIAYRLTVAPEKILTEKFLA